MSPSSPHAAEPLGSWSPDFSVRVVTQTRGGAGRKQNGLPRQLAGVPAATRALKVFIPFYKRAKPAATQGSPRGREWASPRRMVFPRLFLSPPSFFFTHEKERWGAGGSQARTARGVIPRIPTQYPIGLYCPAGQSGNPRRGFPAVKHPTGMFYALPALFWGRDSASRGTRRNVKSPCRRRPGSPRR